MNDTPVVVYRLLVAGIFGDKNSPHLCVRVFIKSRHPYFVNGHSRSSRATAVCDFSDQLVAQLGLWLSVSAFLSGKFVGNEE